MAADDRHDLFPDIRRQLVPPCDQLAQSQVGAGSMQTAARGVGATALLRKDLWNMGRGCDSRRLRCPYLK